MRARSAMRARAYRVTFACIHSSQLDALVDDFMADVRPEAVLCVPGSGAGVCRVDEVRA
jgi:hypothetical protein